MLLGINIGSLFYVALKGAVRGSKWQHIYLNACIINWFSEIFFVQLIEILWIDFMISGSIRNKVLAISEFLNSIGFMIYEKHMNGNISLNPNYIEWLNKLELYSKSLILLDSNSIESTIISNIEHLKNITNVSNINDISFEKNSNDKILNSTNTYSAIILGFIPFELHRIISSILIVLLIILWYNVNFIILILVGLGQMTILLLIGYLKNNKFKKKIEIVLFIWKKIM